uniref:Uncharacterized protein n=1 Tax=Solanum tuberosum TaxID=4113 RepID=M1DZQ7_SOLTU
MVSSLLVALRWYLSEGGGMGRYPYIAQGQGPHLQATAPDHGPIRQFVNGLTVRESRVLFATVLLSNSRPSEGLFGHWHSLICNNVNEMKYSMGMEAKHRVDTIYRFYPRLVDQPLRCGIVHRIP